MQLLRLKNFDVFVLGVGGGDGVGIVIYRLIAARANRVPRAVRCRVI